MGSWSDTRFEAAKRVLKESRFGPDGPDRLSEDERELAAEMFAYGAQYYDGSQGHEDPRLSPDAWAAFWWLVGYDQAHIERDRVVREAHATRSVDVLNPDNEEFPWMREED